MIVRIGIVDSLSELRVELDHDVDVDEIRSGLAVSDIVWLRDRHGNEVAVRTSCVAWVEFDPSA